MHRILFLALLASAVKASNSESPDGIHRIDKRPQTTRHSRLHPRDAGNVCGVDMRLCPSSMGGNCCPENYECGRENCYATTRRPSTCGTKVGWYACAAVYGGGCCPDGYLCQRAAHCVPRSGSPYSFDCPASQYLCPSSMNYGCCPNGMGCAVDQCYSTSLAPVTTSMVVTRTDQGRIIDVIMLATTVASPVTPTTSPDMDSQDQRVPKYYPAAIPKTTPQGGEDSGGREMSAGQLGAIVAGCVSFAVLFLLAAFLLWRRLRSSGGKPDEEPQRSEMSMVETPKDSRGAEPLSVHLIVTTAPASPASPPRRSPGRVQPPSVSVPGGTELALTEHTPPTPAEGSHRRHAGYCDQTSILSPATFGEHHGLPASAINPNDSSPVYSRHARAMSDLSDMSSSFDAGNARRRAPTHMAELEDQHGIAELPDSPSSMPSAAADDWARSDINVCGWVTRSPPPAYSPQQMTRIDGWAYNVAVSRLGVVDEEKQCPL